MFLVISLLALHESKHSVSNLKSQENSEENGKMAFKLLQSSGEEWKKMGFFKK